MKRLVPGYNGPMSEISTQTSGGQPPAWRRRPWYTAATVGMFLVMLAGLISHNHYVLGIGVLLVGLSGLAWAATTSTDGLHRRLSRSRGYGAFLGRLVALVPGIGAKLVWFVLCLAIIALGVATLITR